MRTQPHARRFRRGPRWSALTAPGRITCRVEYNPLIPAAKAQYAGSAVNDWWISGPVQSFSTGSEAKRRMTDVGGRIKRTAKSLGTDREGWKLYLLCPL